MADATLANFVNPILKDRYADGNLPKKATRKASPFLMRVKKDPNWYGKNYVVPLQFTNSAGASADFTKAQANSNPLRNVVFTGSQRYPIHVVDSMAREAMLAGEKDFATFTRSLVQAMDSSLSQALNKMSVQVWGNGGGAIGQIASGSGTATITLTDANSVTGFHIGQTLQVGATDGTSGSPRATAQPANAVVLAITEGDGTAGSVSTITIGGNWSTVFTSCADGDYIFPDGDFGNVATGVSAWIPQTAPTLVSPTFKGVQRGTYPERLAGYRLNAAGSPLIDVMQRLCTLVGRGSGTLTDFYCNFETKRRIATEVASKMRYRDENTDKAKFGYNVLELQAGGISANVVEDPYVPNGVIFGVDMSTWVLPSLKEAPHLVNEQGRDFELKPTADSVEWRYCAYWDLFCNNPSANGIIFGV